ncbi:uncharacterized protein VTP21DRAFT_5332 [Calcarisporiella thermophila]|uniref:uncharacterized protein n=1 Tax=Calcarisporiella thermophila TaxID=911321 RepID=UPI003743BAC0
MYEARTPIPALLNALIVKNHFRKLVVYKYFENFQYYKIIQYKTSVFKKMIIALPYLDASLELIYCIKDRGWKCKPLILQRYFR